MSRDVLDLIDAALNDYATSTDAMRWAPDAPEPEPAAVDFLAVRHRGGPVVTIRMTCTITPAGVKLSLDLAHLRAQLRSRYGRRASAGIRAVLAALNPPPPPAAARLRRMHTEYHRRTRHRRTRWPR
ncbi:MAG TPA: hypothetical protein VFY84_12635 [Jiangellales bacterium]|nr:hypothetical protein [Jiangellales bacterium]